VFDNGLEMADNCAIGQVAEWFKAAVLKFRPCRSIERTKHPSIRNLFDKCAIRAVRLLRLERVNRILTPTQMSAQIEREVSA
jgi:hypothetical protein